MMKIAVVGCGAVGSFYGAKLCRAGLEVHFLLRSDFAVVRDYGVRIRSVEGDFHVWPRCARQAAEIGVCDLVLVALKTTANSELARLVAPLTGQGTLVVTLQNGLGNEAALAACIGPENILGGLCFVCLNRLEPGLIQHTAHGKIVLGEFQRPPADRTLHVAELFRSARIPCDLAENLAAAHWDKLVWNIPFNGLGVAGCAGYEAVVAGRIPPGTVLGPCLPTDRLLGEARWQRLVRELMWEIVHAARAQGYALHDSVVESQIEHTWIMKSYKASTLIDFERGYPLEVESMFVQPCQLAEACGVPVPRLRALRRVLAELEQCHKPS
jgi:2-dehydropantoate 2-reductase